MKRIQTPVVVETYNGWSEIKDADGMGVVEYGTTEFCDELACVINEYDDLVAQRDDLIAQRDALAKVCEMTAAYFKSPDHNDPLIYRGADDWALSEAARIALALVKREQ